MKRYVDMETGEIIDAVSFQAMQARLVMKSRPLRELHQPQVKPQAWSTWAMKLVRHFGTLLVLSAVLGFILLSR
ncbi:hypothetical protein Snoj_04290 [Streptomyces nojiriensis]|uniref:Uncharacterized protein n=1 Tax=Streptomyces nojiriensis TaxID=66374 RepID=A0ABQ3SEF6_9ACTN|nr:hypothetical protein [Streptomyces nojiriensis]QTI48162.1 hypothetical protein JYK04_06022 [Streptomyces nojiriensis]GGS25805.1 hypothetical protein GCM10010205_64760 [Streptomyces nojiriensis]GHI66511.1 hypothetical protein Snoj_04290 [Streptomyces nojiriensis]